MLDISLRIRPGRPSKKRAAICIIVENLPVPPDRRVWQEARALAEVGYHVSVICPKGPGFERSYENLDGIEIYRHSTLEGTSTLGFAFEYTWALITEFALALRVYFRTRFRVLQACNPPDTAFIIGLFFKLLGVRFIFDHHDPAPELYEAKFRKRGVMYFLTRLAEHLTYRTADVAIATNETLRDLATTRDHFPPERSFVVLGCPDLNDFRLPTPRAELKEGRKYLVLYVGVMGPQDGVNLLLDSIDYIVNAMGRSDTLFVLIGPGTELPRLKSRATELYLDACVRFTGALYGNDLLAYFAVADVAVAPDPANQLNHKLTMIKIFEYMACGLPIVLYDLIEGRRSADGAALYAMPNDPIDFGQKIMQLMDSEQLRHSLGVIGRNRVDRRLNWSAQKGIYLEAYETALGAQAPVGDLSK